MRCVVAREDAEKKDGCGETAVPEQAEKEKETWNLLVRRHGLREDARSFGSDVEDDTEATVTV